MDDIGRLVEEFKKRAYGEVEGSPERRAANNDKCVRILSHLSNELGYLLGLIDLKHGHPSTQLGHTVRLSALVDTIKEASDTLFSNLRRECTYELKSQCEEIIGSLEDEVDQKPSGGLSEDELEELGVFDD